MKPFNYTTRCFAAAAGTDPGGGAGGAGLPPVAAAAAPVPDPAVARIQQELTRQRAELDRMRSMAMAPAPTPQTPQQQATQHSDLVREFNRDPISMTAAISQRAVQETLARQGQVGMETQVEMAKQLARGQDPTQQARWDKYYGEIEARMANVDPQYRVNSTLWANAYRMVIGEHVNDIVNEVRQEPQAGGAPAIRISTEGGPAAPSKAAPATGKAEKITSEEHRIAQKFRLTDDQYMEGKKANLEQSDQIMSPTGPSSWDKHVTFSTRDKRSAERQARRASAANKK